MPESRNNMIARGLSGTFPGIGTFHIRGGKTFIRKIRAKPSVPDSEKQIAVKQRFAACSKYAKAAIKDPELKASYEAVTKPGKTAYNMAVADAYYPPKIESFKMDNYHGLPGDSFTVEVMDKFKVVSVTITIYSPAGNLLEQGTAIMQTNELDWLYVATVANESLTGSKITATATDRPGNKVSLMVIL